MICLYKGTSLVSKLIKFRTWSDYSHVSFVAGENLSGPEYEAWHIGGVQRVNSFALNHKPGTRVDLFDIKLTPGENEGLLEFYESQLGKKYDFRAIGGFVLRLNVQDKDALFCAEYTISGFEKIKKPLLARIPAYKVPPGYIPLSPLLDYCGTIFSPTHATPDLRPAVSEPIFSDPQLPQIGGVLS
jgi:hypothetical protein